MKNSSGKILLFVCVIFLLCCAEVWGLVGDLVWKFKTGEEIQSCPAIDNDGTLYIGSIDNYVYALSPEDH